MSRMKITSYQLKKFYIKSCFQELNVLKPGNVNILSSISGMSPKRFIRAAIISSEYLSNVKLTLGECIYQSAAECHKQLGSNYNLGIILLCAPIFKAALNEFNSLKDLRRNVSTVLFSIDKNDSDLIIKSIKKLKPGGIKNYSGEGNIFNDNLEKPIMELMQIGSERDRIAKSYTNNYCEIFTKGLPFFQMQKKISSQRMAVEKLYLIFLSSDLDSHILRKFGTLKAKDILFKSKTIDKIINKKTKTFFYKKLAIFDNYLKSRNINPGTCADLTVTTLLIDKIIGIMSLSNFNYKLN